MRARLAYLAILAAPGACGTPQPERRTTATVYWIAPAMTRWIDGNVRVTARSANGLTADISVPASRLTCHIGDTVRATVRGVALRIEPGACQPPPVRRGRRMA